MGKTAAKDPAEGLEPDITEIDDPKARLAAQMEYYGGELEDDEDDLGDMDRGDNLDGEKEEPTDRGDEVQSEEKEDDDEPEDSDDEADSDDEEAGDDASDDDEADSDDEDEDSGDDEESDDVDESESDDDDDVQSKDDDRNDPRIPLSRFNEVNERMKRAEARIAEIESQSTAKEDAAAQKYDFDAAEEEYMELLLDGKTKEAGAKRAEIRSAEQELFKAETKQEAVSDFDQQQEMRDLNSLSLQAEEMYPVFNESAADYDPVIAGRVVTYMKGYMADGQSVSDAFVSGLADVIQQYGLDASDDEVTESEDTKPQKTVKKGKPIKKTKEKLKAAKQQGQTPAGQGEGSADRGVAAPSIEEMTDEDLDKLSPAQLARLRGDFVE
jgi:hypothetical protein